VNERVDIQIATLISIPVKARRGPEPVDGTSGSVTPSLSLLAWDISHSVGILVR
jgi:hypothetical protein